MASLLTPTPTPNSVLICTGEPVYSGQHVRMSQGSAATDPHTESQSEEGKEGAADRG